MAEFDADKAVKDFYQRVLANEKRKYPHETAEQRTARRKRVRAQEKHDHRAAVERTRAKEEASKASFHVKYMEDLVKHIRSAEEAKKAAKVRDDKWRDDLRRGVSRIARPRGFRGQEDLDLNKSELRRRSKLYSDYQDKFRLPVIR